MTTIVTCMTLAIAAGWPGDATARPSAGETPAAANQPSPTIESRKTGESLVVYLEHAGPYWTLGRKLDEVRKYAGEHGLNGRLFVRYLDDPSETGGSQLKMQIGTTVAKPVEPEEPFRFERLADGMVVAVNSRRDGLRLIPACRALRAWAVTHEYEPTGPVTEYFDIVEGENPGSIGSTVEMMVEKVVPPPPPPPPPVIVRREIELPKPVATATKQEDIQQTARQQETQEDSQQTAIDETPNKQHLLNELKKELKELEKELEAQEEIAAAVKSDEEIGSRKANESLPQRVPDRVSRGTNATSGLPPAESARQSSPLPAPEPAPKPAPRPASESVAVSSPGEANRNRPVIKEPVIKEPGIQEPGLNVDGNPSSTEDGRAAEKASGNNRVREAQLFAETADQKLARRLIPTADNISPGMQIWLGQFVFRISAIGKGVRRINEGDAAGVIVLSDAVATRYAEVSPTFRGDPLAESLVKIDSANAQLALRQRAIMGELDRLMGMVAARGVAVSETEAQLRGIITKAADLIDETVGQNRQNG